MIDEQHMVLEVIDCSREVKDKFFNVNLMRAIIYILDPKTLSEGSQATGKL